MLNINLIRVILTILAENGETRLLTLIKLINRYTNSIKITEPLVFEYYSGKNIMFPISMDGVLIDWGDGQITDTQIHKYKVYTVYRIKIYNKPGEKIGVCGSGTWPTSITEFISLGRIGITNLGYMFYNNLFIKKIHPNWDTSGITDMSGMFCYAQNFNQKIGDNWDTSNVRDMHDMFYNACNFNQKIGDNWDTSRVTDMSYMFYNAHNFNQKIGDNWNISNIINMSWMFSGAFRFNQKIGDNWDTSQVTDMSYMFRAAWDFKQKIGDSWIIPTITKKEMMFNHDFPEEYIPKWYRNN